MSSDLEQSLLGAVLLDTRIYPDVARVIEPEDFFVLAHANLWRLMRELDERPEEWDTMALLEEAVARDVHRYGGAPMILSLPTMAGSSYAWESYARQLRRASFARRLRDCSARLADAIDQGHEPSAALAHHETALLSLRRPETVQDGWVSAGATGAELFANYCEMESQSLSVSGLPTGFADLDARTGGLKPADLIVLGARPSMGKTALATAIAINVAHAGRTVGFFSMEMSRESLMQRVLANRAHVNFGRLQRAQLLRHERESLVEAVRKLESLPLYIDEKCALSLAALRQRARRLANSGPLSLLVVDYLQLAKGEANRGASREQQVAEVSMGLKTIGRELKVPILALAQLNRGLEGRGPKDRRPMLSDLRDSGQIEQDADVVLFLHREEVYDQTTTDRGIAEVIVAKQRNGALGTTRLKWIPEEQRFASLESRFPPDTRARAYEREDA